MKRISFFLALVLVVASFGLAHSQASLYLDAVDGTWDTGKIQPETPVTFYIGMDNLTGFDIDGITNGFAVSVTGGNFTPIVGDTLPTYFDWAGNFDGVKTINYFSADGVGIDTVGFGFAKFFNAGLLDGLTGQAFVITTGGVDSGETMCIDSTFFPPTGAWLWADAAAGSIVPAWDGPHCFLAETAPCLPPTINNAPVSLGGSHCDVISFDFNADAGSEGGAIVWSADIGTIDANGMWSYSPTLADVGASVSVTVTATDVCGSDATVNLNFTNEAPVISCPAPLDVSAGVVANATVTATDDCDGISFSIVNDGGIGATVDPNTGVVTASMPSGVAATYTVEVEATDGNASSTCIVEFNAVVGSLYQVEIPCIGEPEGPVYQGQHFQVPVNLITGNVIGGYQLLIAYDNSALSFQMAEMGSDLMTNDWEYFTYRFGPDGNCSNACPSGLLLIVAIAETNDGLNHPTEAGVTELAVLDFLVTNDRTFECQSIPIRFFWTDCADNALSNWAGDELHISEFVYDGDEVLFPPNGNEIQDPTYGFPTYFGAQDECVVVVPNKPTPIRDVSFNNGCLFIACSDAIDARGDINLNFVSNEIADAVLYSNYFVYGLGVFNINLEGQIAASDVNNDGLTLSVADLVYLVRVIVGDALPYPKLSPTTATIVNDHGVLSVDGEMGAALVVAEGNVNVEVLAEGMEIKSEFVDGFTRALVYSFDGNTFNGEFINVDGNIVSVELGSAEGADVTVAKIIPANFELAQNYPNPFNPTTTLGFSIPVASDVNLVIYNVTGQKVAEFSGSYEAGIHTIEWDASNNASGVYFYKLNAGNFAETKKMVLLK